MEHCLRRIEGKVCGDPSKLDDPDIQDIFVLNLQRAVQSVIDVAAHVIKDDSLEIATSMREYFEILARNDSVSEALSKKLEKMVGFRNIAVYDYEVIDPARLKQIYLEDLARTFHQPFCCVCESRGILNSCARPRPCCAPAHRRPRSNPIVQYSRDLHPLATKFGEMSGLEDLRRFQSEILSRLVQ
jgi:uncharacterized protein YutE (UPF0331/DUF86 family)